MIEIAQIQPSPTRTNHLVNTTDIPSARGQWLPDLGGNTTYVSRSATYLTVGGLCFVWGVISVSVLGTGSAVGFSGFPFTAREYSIINVGNTTGLAVAVVSLYLVIGGLTKSANFRARTAATVSDDDNVAIFADGTELDFSGVYEIVVGS